MIVSANTLEDTPEDEEVCIYTYFQVKEDGVSLFGFYSLEEKDLFLKLITVSGVGGKTAIQILSGAKPKEIIHAIVIGDLKVFKGIKGIGKKTAELICVSLREKIADTGYIDEPQQMSVKQKNQQIIDDTCETLIGLGLKKSYALDLIKSQYTGTEDLETLVTKCLRNMK